MATRHIHQEQTVPVGQMESNPLSKQNRNATIRPNYIKEDGC